MKKFILYTLLGICGAAAASVLIVYILKKVSRVEDLGVEELNVNSGEANQLTGSEIPEIQDRGEKVSYKARRGYISIPLGRH